MKSVSNSFKFPCPCCSKPVKSNQKGLKCTECKQWLHISCAGIPCQMYDDMSERFVNWQCNICLFKQLPHHNAENVEESKSNDNMPSSHTPLCSYRNLVYKEFSGNGLNIAQLNVNSILKHVDEIKSLVKQNNIHLLALNETKVDHSIFDDEINIHNYSLVRKDRTRQGGGVAIYIHKSLHYEKLTHESMNDLEIIAIKLYLRNSEPIVLSTWYRPPSSSVDVFNHYEDFLIYVDGLGLDTIVIGDTNCDLLSHSLSSTTKRYIELNDLYAFVQINKTEPTRVTNVSATLVDHILTNCPDNVKKHGVIHNGLSDHSISYLVLNSCISSCPKLISFRSCKSLDADKFRDDIRKQPWAKLTKCHTIDQAVEIWQSLLMDIIDKHMPMHSKRVRDRDSPWMSSDIYKLMKKRDKLKKKACRLKDEKLMGEYRKLRNKVTAEIGKAKKKYYSDKLSEFNNSPNNTWKTLKSFIPKKKGDSSVTVNSSSATETANRFNTFFAEVGSSLADKVPDAPHVRENENHVEDSFEFTSVNETDVLSIIRNLRNTKSVGLDSISVFVLKLCALEIAPSISYLINFSLKSGKFPTQWKSAKIIPIHKSGDKDIPSNYRPISILPCVSKILERVVQRQILAYLHKNNILSPAQSGFRPRHSTITTLIKVTNDWFQAIDNKEYTGAVFVDLKKAFDTVDCDTLIKKLNIIGINGLPSSWIRSYMTNRVCRTFVNSKLSSESSISCGVPQGSLLGPLLFIIYVNDLVECVESCKIQLYADDTVLYFSHSSINNIELALNSDLKNVYNWMCQNKLTVNCQKTECMLLGSKHMLSKENVLQITLHKSPLNQVRLFKYLGMICDENLNWNYHIENMLQKIGKMVGFLGRLRRSLSESILNTIYRSLILPLFDYGDVIYSSSFTKYTDKLQKLQNRAARIILKVKFEHHVSVPEMHNALHWQLLDERRHNHSLVFMYKILNDLTPTYLRNEFEYVPQHYSSRFGEILYLPKPRTDYLKRSFKYRCAKAYNVLPPATKSSSTVNAFKSRISHT